MRYVRGVARGMLAAALAVPIGALVGTAARAQTHGARPAKPPAKPKPAASGAAEAPADDRPPSAPPAPFANGAGPGPASASNDAGVVAAPPEPAAGGRLSPLNPAAAEFSDAGASPTGLDYDRLLADLAALRARVAAVSDTLFHSRIAISLATNGEPSRIRSISVSLDDGTVWTSPASFRADDATTIYDHAVAPGNHAVTVEVEERDRTDATFRATQRSRFVVDVPTDQRLAVDVTLWDDSDMGSFVKDRQGRYELRVRARAKAQATGR